MKNFESLRITTRYDLFFLFFYQFILFSLNIFFLQKENKDDVPTIEDSCEFKGFKDHLMENSSRDSGTFLSVPSERIGTADQKIIIPAEPIRL